nr:hypothetical protein [Candidatus Sigynarchaeota archaeon]
MDDPTRGRVYITLINVFYAGAIIAWLLAVFIMLNWNITLYVDFFNDAWEPVKNMLFFIAGGIFIFMSIKLLVRYKNNKKLSALLLAIFNLGICGSNVIEGFGNSLRFADLLDATLQNLTYVSFTWGIAFLFLFLQEILAGSFLDRKNLGSQLFFFSMMAAAVVMLVTSVMLSLPGAFTFVAMGLVMLVTVILSVWQIRAGFKLRRKTEDRNAKNGLMMIGMSGILILFLLFFILFKAINVMPGFEFDYLIPPMAVAISVAMYLGYINPSKASPPRSS